MKHHLWHALVLTLLARRHSANWLAGKRFWRPAAGNNYPDDTPNVKLVKYFERFSSGAPSAAGFRVASVVRSTRYRFHQSTYVFGVVPHQPE
jgi:hypothetical protein